MYRHFLLFATVLLIKNLWVSHAIDVPHINNPRMVYKPKAISSLMHDIEMTNSNLKYNNQNDNKWKRYNLSKNQFIKDNVNDNKSSKHGVYYPQRHIQEGKTDVHLKNDLNFFYKIYQKQHDSKKHYEQQHLQQVNENQLLMLKQLENKSDLSEGYLDFNEYLYQKMAPNKHTAKNSNDYFQAQNLTAHVTPSPSHAEMHLDLQHQQLNGNIQAVVSHAAGTEASPITATSLKSHKLDYGKLKFIETVTQTSSNQYIFAPKRSFSEKELSQTNNILPYPPSFISLTTTERPSSQIIHKSIDTKLPDFFLYRQYKSLWDSYIPSWKITEMMQQFQSKKEFNNVNNNLHTVVLITN